MDLKFKDNSKLRLKSSIQLEYIESTGTQWIDTGISGANDNLKIHIRCKVQVAYFPYVASNGYVDEQTNATRIIGGNNQSNIVVSLNSKPANSLVVSVANIATYNDYFFYKEGSTLKCSVNGSSPLSGAAVAGAENNTNIVLFIGAVAGIAMLKIYDGDALVRDFVPYKHNGKVCLYDTVSETFFYNQGTGDFVAGPVIKQYDPETILLKTTTLYHKNTPNIDGLQLLNNIFNYQKTHQDEVKEYYYPTTQLWQDIITEYPDIVQYYNMNHKLCVVICEADDPEQFTEDLLEIIEDYPDIVDVILDYPDLISMIKENPNLAPIIAEYPSLAPIIAENPEVVHNLVDTGYESSIKGNGAQYIDTGLSCSSTMEIKLRITYGNDTGIDLILGNAWDNRAYLIQRFTNFTLVCFWGGRIDITIQDVNKFIDIDYKANYLSVDGTVYPNSGTPSITSGTLKLLGLGDHNNTASKLSLYKRYDNNVLTQWLVPIQNNGNPCMIDLLTGTKYLNQGTGSFTYSLEPKNV